jgi:hypothetical protein
MNNGLSKKRADIVGDPSDEKGFSLHSDPNEAQKWADVAADRHPGTSGSVVIKADESNLPPLQSSRSGWSDPGERFIPADQMHSVGPGVFGPHNPPDFS